MMLLPGGAGFLPVADGARRLHDFMLPLGTFRRFDLARVVRLLLDVLSGLRALHEARIGGVVGFVHGQVSPKHIYLDGQGNARLVPLVGTHVVPVVEPAPTGYLAPEQLQGREVDVRADLFSVGVMLWEALSAKAMFRNLSAEAALERLQGGKLARATLSAEAAWAEPLKAMAQRALRLNPEERWSSARELRDAIVDAVGARVAALGGDSWPDEAPTPVLQPRLHFMPPRARDALPLPLPSPLPVRAQTPPPAVIQLPAPTSPAPHGMPKAKGFSSKRVLSGLGLALCCLLAVMAWRQRAGLQRSAAEATQLGPPSALQASQPPTSAAARSTGPFATVPLVNPTPSANPAPSNAASALPAAPPSPSALVPKKPRLPPAPRKPAVTPKRSSVEDDVARYGI